MGDDADGETVINELWNILYAPEKAAISLFEWKHLHLRAVWQAVNDDEGNPIDVPQNVIVVQEKGDMEIASALVDVIQSKGNWLLRTRPLVSRPARPPGDEEAWVTDSGYPKRDAKQNPELGEDVPFSKKDGLKIFVDSYQRGDGTDEYEDFMEELADAWKGDAIGFNHRPTSIQNGISVKATNWSMGITIVGLAYQRLGTYSIIRTVVTSGAALALHNSATGIHYTGLGIASRDFSKNDWLGPLGAMFLDTLFLDSFSLDPHPETKPVKGWPVKGVMASFFRLPGAGTLTYTHAEERVDETTTQPIVVDNVKTYKMRAGALKITDGDGDKYDPMTTISFLFEKEEAAVLTRARNGRALMDFLTGNPVDLKKIKDMLKYISSNLVFKSETAREQVALKIFGNKKFLGEPKKKDTKVEAAKAANKQVNDELEKAQKIILNINKLQKNFLASAKKAFSVKKSDVKNLRGVLANLKPMIQNSKQRLKVEKETLGVMKVRNIFSSRVKEIEEHIGGLQRAWGDLMKEIQTQSLIFLNRDYNGIDKLFKTLQANLDAGDEKTFIKNAPLASEALDNTKDLIATADGILDEKIDSKKQNKLRHDLLHLLEAVVTAQKDKDKAAVLLKELKKFKTRAEKVIEAITESRAIFTAAVNIALKVDPEEDRTKALVEAVKIHMESNTKFGKEFNALSDQYAAATTESKKNIEASYNKMDAAWGDLGQYLLDQINVFLNQDVKRATLQVTAIMVTAVKNIDNAQMVSFQENSTKVQNTINTMNQLAVLVKPIFDQDVLDRLASQQKTLQDELTKLQNDTLDRLKEYRTSLQNDLKTATTAVSKTALKDAIALTTKQIIALQKDLKMKTEIDKEAKKKLDKTRREIIYGSAKGPTATILYMLGSRGRIDAQRIREDPVYTGSRGPEVANLSNLSLEFYGSSAAALASQLSQNSSIRAKNLTPKAVTADGGRLEQTDFDYYYGLHWVDDYTGFETSGGSVSSSPGNYVAIPDHGALLYHLGATKVGSLSYDFGNMVNEVPLDNPDFEIMLQIPKSRQDTAASPGSSNFFVSGAIILGLRVPESGSGLYSVRSLVYAPNLVKM